MSKPVSFGPEENLGRNRKGCDFGYALADDSCEGVSSVEACTVTALERSPLSRFQTPADTSQCSRFFRVWRSRRSPGRTDHPAYFGTATFSCRPFLPSMKAYDVGYAPSDNSCERVTGVDACTVAALV